MRLIDADNLKIPNDAPYKASVKRVVAMQPTVEAREVGKWEECDWVGLDEYGDIVRYHKRALRCSNCRNAFKKDFLWKNNFCPECGADMRGEKRE